MSGRSIAAMGARPWVEVADGRILAITQGDLARVLADAVVNAANESLIPGGGVDAAIHRGGGPAILRDLASRYGSQRHLATGDAVVTTAGLLPARWVIHAVGPVWRGGGDGERDLLEAAYRASLARADEVGARSIAFPAISCGVYGYPLDEGAEVGLRTVADGLAHTRSVQKATFVLFSFDTYAIFQRALDRLAEDRTAA
jgi:O-acetyl-ADP-ribose deacetylase (regulator of RNase III)